MTKALIDQMVDRFLSWPLPDSVASDLCVTEAGHPHRSGTSLLTATEAKAMLEHVLEDTTGRQTIPKPIALESVTLASLPALKHPLDGGTFVGVIMLPDEKIYAIVLLAEKPPKRLTWKKAMQWAASVGGRLPSRAIAAVMFALAKDLLPPDWCWTDEQEGQNYAWYCYFFNGLQNYCHQHDVGCAVAVRMIPLIP